MKSITSVKQSQIEEKWFLIDANGARIGVLASKVAELLQGKNNPLTKPYHKPSTHVVILNADKIEFNTKRGVTKFYKSYSGYPGGLKYKTLKESHTAKPENPIEHAIKGMLPRTKRGDLMFSNLKVYSGEINPHEAQSPLRIDLKSLKI